LTLPQQRAENAALLAGMTLVVIRMSSEAVKLRCHDRMAADRNGQNKIDIECAIKRAWIGGSL
jgi:hypothetical protein